MEKNQKLVQKPWFWNAIISLVVIAILTTLLLMSFLIFHKVHCEEISGEMSNLLVATFAFIISSYAIFVATAVFLPKYQLEQKVKDYEDRMTDKEEEYDKHVNELKTSLAGELRSEINKKLLNLEQENKTNKIEILRTEAHYTRMFAKFLLDSRSEYEWAIGWSFKSVKTYMKLYMLKPLKYKEFIKNLDGYIQKIGSRLIKIEENDVLKTTYLNEQNYFKQGSEIRIRAWKDYIESLKIYKDIRDISDKTFEEDDNFKEGRWAFRDMLKRGAELLRIQISLYNVEDKEVIMDQIKLRMREEKIGEDVIDQFENFLRNKDVKELKVLSY